MRKSNTQQLSNILRDFIKDNNLEPKLKERDLINAWDTLLGKAIASYTKNIYIKDKTLYVTLSSPVVKSELMMMKGELLTQLNQEVGEKVITSIVFR